MHPKRFFAYWFSREGAIMALKVAGTGILLLVLLFGALFAYYRRDLAAIRPGELSNRVQTTVTKYLDRNGVVLWEDKGTDDYRLVVSSGDISKYMKDATIAIEDKDFYKHSGFSLPGIVRATVNNFKGGDTQGASTLTQQLVKQVFLSDEAGERGLGGIPRKIKETILAIEVERTYNKDQILTLYLNESPYGGRRNGVESAAQTYFGKSAKDLDLAESSLVASIPQQPGRFDPYNVLSDESAKKDLITRQHITLNNMVEQKMITKEQAATAKKEAVLDSVRPAADQYNDSKAPHFVQMVKAQLESDLGKATVGNGGLTIKTTLDWRVQQVVDKAITDLFNGPQPASAGFDNAAATVVDSQTGQILGLRGSRDFNYPDYGAVNASTSFIQPGSSVKPFVFASLFEQKNGTNYGAGSVLADEPIPQSIYKTEDGQSVQNFDLKFRGALPIRNMLPESRNIPAIKALFINDQVNGTGATVKEIHKFGDLTYCTVGQEKQVGLGAAIGSCSVKQTEHANTFATLARMGVYKPVASVLEVKNAEGQVIQRWKDEGKQVLDPQVAYIINDILSDDSARVPSFGARARGLYIPGVKSSAKTGTSNLGTKSRDLWINNYSPKAVVSVWAGNHNGAPLKDALSYRIGPTVGEITGSIHTDVFQKDGSWKPSDWYTRPSGVQTLSVGGRTDLFPSWYSKNSGNNSVQMTFDKVSKKKATDCTPEGAKDIQTVSKTTDPVSRQTNYIAPFGYDASSDDDVHRCDDIKANILSTSASRKGNTYLITADIGATTHPTQTVELLVNGSVQGTLTGGGSNTTYQITTTLPKNASVSVRVTDSAYYTDTRAVSISGNND